MRNFCSNKVEFILLFRKKIEVLPNIHLPVVLHDRFSVCKYSPFSRKYHVFKERWKPAEVDDSLHCEEEKEHQTITFVVLLLAKEFCSCFLIYQKNRRQMIMRFLKWVSAVTSIHNIESLLWEFNRDLAGSYKICSL